MTQYTSRENQGQEYQREQGQAQGKGKEQEQRQGQHQEYQQEHRKADILKSKDQDPNHAKERNDEQKLTSGEGHSKENIERHANKESGHKNDESYRSSQGKTKDSSSSREETKDSYSSQNRPSR